MQRESLCVESDSIHIEEVVYAQGTDMSDDAEDMVRAEGGVSGKNKSFITVLKWRR